jgi:polynucleotide 5'-kinase involved in rRNA processing
MSTPDLKNASASFSDIKRYLDSEKKKFLNFQQEPKALLLGSSDAGKSTFLKQLKILHLGGFTSEETEKSRVAITQSILRIVNILAENCNDQDLQTVIDN